MRARATLQRERDGRLHSWNWSQPSGTQYRTVQSRKGAGLSRCEDQVCTRKVRFAARDSREEVNEVCNAISGYLFFSVFMELNKTILDYLNIKLSIHRINRNR